MRASPPKSNATTGFTDDNAAMLLKIHHRTHYRFEHPVPYGLQRLRLIPKENAAQHIVRWDTNIEGGKVEADYLDFHNNHILLVSIDESATEIVVTCDGEVETSDTKGILGKHGGYVPLWYFLKPTRLTEPGEEIRRSPGPARRRAMTRWPPCTHCPSISARPCAMMSAIPMLKPRLTLR